MEFPPLGTVNSTCWVDEGVSFGTLFKWIRGEWAETLGRNTFWEETLLIKKEMSIRPLWLLKAWKSNVHFFEKWGINAKHQNIHINRVWMNKSIMSNIYPALAGVWGLNKKMYFTPVEQNSHKFTKQLDVGCWISYLWSQVVKRPSAKQANWLWNTAVKGERIWVEFNICVGNTSSLTNNRGNGRRLFFVIFCPIL